MKMTRANDVHGLRVMRWFSLGIVGGVRTGWYVGLDQISLKYVIKRESGDSSVVRQVANLSNLLILAEELGVPGTVYRHIEALSEAKRTALRWKEREGKYREANLGKRIRGSQRACKARRNGK